MFLFLPSCIIDPLTTLRYTVSLLATTSFCAQKFPETLLLPHTSLCHFVNNHTVGMISYMYKLTYHLIKFVQAIRCLLPIYLSLQWPNIDISHMIVMQQFKR